MDVRVTANLASVQISALFNSLRCVKRWHIALTEQHLRLNSTAVTAVSSTVRIMQDLGCTKQSKMKSNLTSTLQALIVQKKSSLPVAGFTMKKARHTKMACAISLSKQVIFRQATLRLRLLTAR